MNSDALVQLALDALSCSQKDLAQRLDVSPTQISKWKKGEHMSNEMEDRLREIAKIGDQHPSFILWAGGIQEAAKWEKLIHYLAENAGEAAETGYNTYPLLDEHEERLHLCWHTFYVLREMGVDLPKKFPKELDLDYGSDDIEMVSDSIDRNPYSRLIYEIFASLNDVYGFYAAYIAELIQDDELELLGTPAGNIEPCLLELAACKIDVDAELAPKVLDFKRKVTNDYVEWLSVVKDKAFRAGAPLRAELMGLVYENHDSLGHEAEAESLGFNSSRVHPDIYMNELLCGMRVIHQVLPAVLEKLGIDFKIDESELRI